ncbi:MAG: hypothetical protein Kow00128_00120 [Deltaproteobacteria bacterium]
MGSAGGRWGRAGILLAGLVLLSASCDSPRHKSEVIQGTGERKTTIRGATSDETYSLFQRIAEGYSSRHNVLFEVSQTHSGNIPELLSSGAIDIGVTSRRITDAEKDRGLSYLPFAYDGAVVLASSDTKVRSLSRRQIRKILEGKITNWKEVGGADAKIHLIVRPPYSSVSRALGNSLFGGPFPQPEGAFVLETAESTYQALKSIHSYLAFAPLSRTIVDQFPAVPVAVDGVAPLLVHVPGAKYPAPLEYGILFRQDAPEPVAEFARYLVSLEGMHRITSLGLAPASTSLSLSTCHCRATEGTFLPTRRSELAGQLTIAVVPELGAIEQERRYAGVCRLIAEELGVRTRLKHLETYGRVVEEFEQGRVDVAFVGSLVYGTLHARFGATPLARPESKGVSHYRGVVIVRSDGGIRRMEELRGKRFAFVPNTSAGELYTMTLAKREGSGVDDYFSKVERVSSHADVVRLVDSGAVDGGAVKDLVLDRILHENPGLRKRFRILETSDSFPENALVVSRAIDERTARRLQEILLTCAGSDRGKAALQALGADRFIPTVHEDYRTMEAMAKASGYDFLRH